VHSFPDILYDSGVLSGHCTVCGIKKNSLRIHHACLPISWVKLFKRSLYQRMIPWKGVRAVLYIQLHAFLTMSWSGHGNENTNISFVGHRIPMVQTTATHFTQCAIPTNWDFYIVSGNCLRPWKYLIITERRLSDESKNSIDCFDYWFGISAD
jgi:hypothetical protein